VTSLFVAAGGGGDVIAASILQRKWNGPSDRTPIVTYSWDRLFVDPVPGPRTSFWFTHIQPVGLHNHLVTGRSGVISPGHSLLPRLARELRREFYLLDPRRGAVGMRRQISSLVRHERVDSVCVVDSGGDIVARGDEAELRSPLADSLVLAATDGLGVPVHVLITAIGLDGELSPDYVRDTVTRVRGDIDIDCVSEVDVTGYATLSSWHPSEVNGLLIAAARGFEGTVEIRDAGVPVHVSAANVTVHRCDNDALIAHNHLTKSMIESTSLADAERSLLQHRDYSELMYQRNRAPEYRSRPHVGCVEGRIARLLAYRATSTTVDAVSLRRAAEIMEVDVHGLSVISPELERRFPDRFRPPVWRL
jgi:hypothetical protein